MKNEADDYCELNRYIKSVSTNPSKSSENYDNVDLYKQLKHELELFFDKETLEIKSDICKFWEQKKMAYPMIYPISQILLGIPATEVSVERLFSGLRYILSPFRNCLSEEMLQNVILVRCNKKW